MKLNFSFLNVILLIIGVILFIIGFIIGDRTSIIFSSIACTSSIIGIFTFRGD